MDNATIVRSKPMAVGLLAVLAFLPTLIVRRANGDDSRTRNVIAEYSLDQPGAVLVVPVTIAEEQYRFMLDTGSARSTFNVPLRKLLGKPLAIEPVSTPLGRHRLPTYEAPSMALGPVRLHTPECVYCADLTLDSQIFGERIDGDLGMDVLQHLVLRIDFDAASLRILRSTSPADGRAVPIHRRAGVPFIETDIGTTRKHLMLIDTGRNGPDAGMLAHDIFQQLLATRALDIVGSGYTASLSRARRMLDGRVTRITVAGRATDEPIFAQGPGSLLGLGYLSRYIITFDFPNNVMYLLPGKQVDRIDVPDRSGLHILRIGDDIVVHSVDHGSPAESCGLEKDDVLLTVDESIASELTMYDLRARFRVATGQVRLLVHRQHARVRIMFDAGAESSRH